MCAAHVSVTESVRRNIYVNGWGWLSGERQALLNLVASRTRSLAACLSVAQGTFNVLSPAPSLENIYFLVGATDQVRSDLRYHTRHHWNK